MKNTLLCFAFIMSIFSLSSLTSAEDKKTHLFVMSGQSNMAGLDLNVSFIPAVEKEFGKENVIVAKQAQGGQPIRRWYKKYQYPDKRELSERDKKNIGDLYPKLLIAVQESVKNKNYDTVTFCWMQGERDAKEKLSKVYADSFKGIISQLKEDLKVKRIYFVIGRLSDWGMKNEEWKAVRDVQVKLAEKDDDGQWINTDDLNDGKNKQGKKVTNDLHYCVAGYKTLGERFAKRSIALIQGKVKKKADKKNECSALTSSNRR